MLLSPDLGVDEVVETTVFGDLWDLEVATQYMAVYDASGDIEWAAAVLQGDFEFMDFITRVEGLTDGTALLSGGFLEGASFRLDDGTWQQVHTEGEMTAFLAKVCP